MDVIRISGLRIEAHVGVTDDERSAPQTLLVNLELVVDARAAGKSDDLDDTVDYGRVTEEIAELVRRLRPRLLEHIAERIAEKLEDHSGIRGVTVEVMKVKPPIPENIEGAGVRIERTFVR